MRLVGFVIVATVACIAGRCAFASGGAPDGNAESQPSSAPVSIAENPPASPSLKQRLIDSLPPAIGDGLDIDAWGWFADAQNNQKEYDNYYDVEFSLGITKSFDQRFVVSAQGNFIDANGTTRGELEQGYASMLIDASSGAFLTAGKFNANFGVEGRDFWNRTTGTTSLLFGAQPQDIVGIMLTLPVGNSGIRLRPFVTEDFQGQFYFNQAPYGGLSVEWQPFHELTFGITAMAGPGFVPYGGRPMHSPYPQNSYGGYGDGDDEYNSSSIISNWQGPNLDADIGGTMYFIEAKASWQLRPDLRLSAEYLQESTSTSDGTSGWFGFLAQADYDVTDRWHCFARWSFLDDHDWLVTGVIQRAQEVSAGAGYEILEGVEVRGEYRHDFSDAAPGVDTVSVHLTFTY